MNCLLLIFCLSGLYAEVGAGYVPDPGVPVAKYLAQDGRQAYATFYRLDMLGVSNPRGRVAIGYELDLGKFRFDLQLRHESWIGTTTDRGEESIWGSLRVRPFD